MKNAMDASTVTPLQKPPTMHVHMTGLCMLQTLVPTSLPAHMFQVLGTNPLPSKHKPQMYIHLLPHILYGSTSTDSRVLQMLCTYPLPHILQMLCVVLLPCVHTPTLHTCVVPPCPMFQMLCMHVLALTHMATFVNLVPCPCAFPQFGGNSNGQRDTSSCGLCNTDRCGDGHQ